MLKVVHITKQEHAKDDVRDFWENVLQPKMKAQAKKFAIRLFKKQGINIDESFFDQRVNESA